ncbi:MAG TPA: hypothetical protein VF695_11125 [Sphingomonas sp.]|jgi:hypothetical protein
MTTPDKARLAELLAMATPGPWAYRPQQFDDWGVIRTTVGNDGWFPLVAQARNLSDADPSEHRRDKTDPAGPNAQLIVAAVNALPNLLAENAALKQGLADIFGHFKDRDQAPDHCHTVPGFWDDDSSNGDLAGKPCDWCAKWERARLALQEPDRC